MPVTLGCYTIVSLGLIGIPPFSGFISKWQLAQGALSADVGVFGWLGPVVLLVSALLTAGYLLPVTMKGFLPGRAYRETEKKQEPSLLMLVPLLVLAGLTVLLGLFPGLLTRYAGAISASLFLGRRRKYERRFYGSCNFASCPGRSGDPFDSF